MRLSVRPLASSNLPAHSRRPYLLQTALSRRETPSALGSGLKLSARRALAFSVVGVTQGGQVGSFQTRPRMTTRSRKVATEHEVDSPVLRGKPVMKCVIGRIRS